MFCSLISLLTQTIDVYYAVCLQRAESWEKCIMSSQLFVGRVQEKREDAFVTV